jgi:kynurenine formamidase
MPRPTLLLFVLCAVSLGSVSFNAGAQSWRVPAAGERCPSKWGAADERGAANHVTPASVLAATSLIRSGEVIELGRVLETSMPFFGTRRFEIHTKRTNGPFGDNRRTSNEELVITELGQVGTQFDAFPHQGIGDELYNCFDAAKIASRNGFAKLGVEKVGTLFSRGVLLDIAALRATDMLPAGYEISAEDLQAAALRQGVEIRSGDAVLLHTGFGKLWNVDNTRYNASTPGIGAAAAEYLAARDVLLIGADTFGVEVTPTPDKSLSLPVHQIALVVNGIYLLENMKLDELAAKRVYEFAFVVQPLKIKGGSGSTVAPVAIR